MKKRLILLSLMLSSAPLLTGCDEDLRADAVSGIEIRIIESGQGRIFGTPRATFIPSPNIPPGRGRDVNGPAPDDRTYLDKFPSGHDEDGYLCNALGQCSY